MMRPCESVCVIQENVCGACFVVECMYACKCVCECVFVCVCGGGEDIQSTELYTAAGIPLPYSTWYSTIMKFTSLAVCSPTLGGQ